MGRGQRSRSASRNHQTRFAEYAATQLRNTHVGSRRRPSDYSGPSGTREACRHNRLPSSFASSSAGRQQPSGSCRSLQAGPGKAFAKEGQEMNRTPLKVADIIRAAGDDFIDRNERHLAWPQVKVLRAILNCRTQSLGGHLDRCSGCGHEAISYNSCRNRHCPKCQTNAREQWLAKRSEDLLPVPYFHVVFTLPHDLSGMALQNKKLMYDLLFRAAAETLIEIAVNPKYLGANIGFLAVLHTWGQNLQHHPHVHCVIPAGGLAPDPARWIRAPTSFFLPVRVLSKVFRGKFVDGLKRLFQAKKLGFHGALRSLADWKQFRSFLRQLFRKDWVVYAK